MPEALLATVVRVAAGLLPILGRKAVSRARQGQIAAAASTVLVAGSAERFIEQLNPGQLRRLEAFIKSPQFEHLMLQTMLCSLAGYKEDDNLAIRDQLRASLRHNEVFEEADLVQATDVLFESLHSSVHAVRTSAPGALDHGYAVAIASQVATAGARNSELLERIETINDFNRFAIKIRGQGRALYGKLRLPNVVQSRSVTYAQLYVAPTLSEQEDKGNLGINSVIAHRLRFVVLGDPGAGKSTLGAKLVYDLASGKVPGLEQQVPLLLVVRDHTPALRTEHETLVHYLEASCRRAFGVTPPPDALEYLLLNGLATVIIDGVDELGESRFRDDFARMVEAFAHLYPLTRIVVTSRVVGYDEAPLDEQLFPTIRINPFSDRQVSAYVRQWFRLDSTLMRDRQEALWDAFMRDSNEASDLRTNPLMLSLLCVLYSSEGFIPRNRPSVYEKCAELLFDTWDRSRGIDFSHQFRPYVKPAVQQMAWRLFTDVQERQALPKTEMVHFLATSVLAKRFDDHEEAVQAADDFLRFCAGRAWVLTDTGSDALEPHYGFVHRTFLEYFAAAQLVKQRPDPSAVWMKLSPNIEDAKWLVVSQVAVQILDRAYEDGGDALLRIVISEAEAEGRKRPSSSRTSRLLHFAVRCLDTIAPHTATVRKLTRAVVAYASDLPTDIRRNFLLQDPISVRGILAQDLPLAALLWVQAPENVHRVARALADAAEEFAKRFRADSSAGIVYDALRQPGMSIGVGVDVASLTEAELIDRTPPTAAATWNRLIYSPTAEDVRELGLEILYQTTQVCNLWINSYGQQLLLHTVVESAPRRAEWAQWIKVLEDLYDVVASSGWPQGMFGRQQDWSAILSHLSADVMDQISPKARATALLLLVPIFRNLRGVGIGDEKLLWFATAPLEGARRPVAIELVNSWKLPELAHHRLIEWVQSEKATY